MRSDYHVAPVTSMSFFRQYIAPLFIFLLFLVALAAVSARIFLPADMAGPAVMDEPVSRAETVSFVLAPADVQLSTTLFAPHFAPLLP